MSVTVAYRLWGQGTGEEGPSTNRLEYVNLSINYPTSPARLPGPLLVNTVGKLRPGVVYSIYIKIFSNSPWRRRTVWLRDCLEFYVNSFWIALVKFAL